MVFSSNIFLFLFLPITIIGYGLCGKKMRNMWLLLVSLFFYAWGEPTYVVLMIFSILLNYVFALLIDRSCDELARKALLTIGAVVNLSFLVYFKYLSFILENIGALLNIEFDIGEISLPIGISFYTFQALSYLLDVYRKDVKVQRNILNLALYISFFPQLIAGPIVRYIDIERQMDNRVFTTDNIYHGLRRFMKGFSKKILISDVAAQVADIAFGIEGITGPLAWLGALAYMIQIYFDFSGYSDMAIGLGRMFGFDFLENFDHPYIAKSIKEFWRRWHISLSGWFRDYVYIPLGGSRCGTIKTYRNLIIVFLLTGIWHGASWNFVFWGIYYGAFLVIERMFLGKILEKMPAVITHLYTLVVVYFGWIFFRAESLTAAMEYIQGMFVTNSAEWTKVAFYLTGETILVLILGTIFSVPLYGWIEKKLKYNWIYDILNGSIFILAIIYMVGNGFSPFLYFRF